MYITGHRHFTFIIHSFFKIKPYRDYNQYCHSSELKKKRAPKKAIPKYAYAAATGLMLLVTFQYSQDILFTSVFSEKVPECQYKDIIWNQILNINEHL